MLGGAAFSLFLDLPQDYAWILNQDIENTFGVSPHGTDLHFRAGFRNNPPRGSPGSQEGKYKGCTQWQLEARLLGNSEVLEGKYCLQLGKGLKRRARIQ